MAKTEKPEGAFVAVRGITYAPPSGEPVRVEAGGNVPKSKLPAASLRSLLATGAIRAKDGDS